MGSSPEIYYHIGLPKTATTYLQRKVFPKFKGICFHKKHDFEYHDRIIEETSCQKIFFSCERDRGMENFLKEFTSKYPDVKIMLSLRRHDKWIASRYRYHIRKSGFLTFNEFIDIKKDTGFWKKNELYFFNYIQLIEKYCKFPPLVIFQDDLKDHPYKVFDKITEFLGAYYDKKDISLKTVKKAYNDKQLWMVRKFNKFTRHNPDRFRKSIRRSVHRKCNQFFLHSTAIISGLIPDFVIPHNDFIPDDMLAEIRKFYAEDWERCMKYASEHNMR